MVERLRVALRFSNGDAGGFRLDRDLLIDVPRISVPRSSSSVLLLLLVGRHLGGGFEGFPLVRVD